MNELVDLYWDILFINSKFKIFIYIIELNIIFNISGQKKKKKGDFKNGSQISSEKGSKTLPLRPPPNRLEAFSNPWLRKKKGFREACFFSL